MTTVLDLGAVQSFNASLTYLVGDARVLAEAELHLQAAFKRGEIFGKAVDIIATPKGALTWISSGIGAGHASIHRIGERFRSPSHREESSAASAPQATPTFPRPPKTGCSARCRPPRPRP